MCGVVGCSRCVRVVGCSRCVGWWGVVGVRVVGCSRCVRVVGCSRCVGWWGVVGVRVVGCSRCVRVVWCSRCVRVVGCSRCVGWWGAGHRLHLVNYPPTPPHMEGVYVLGQLSVVQDLFTLHVLHLALLQLFYGTPSIRPLKCCKHNTSCI